MSQNDRILAVLADGRGHRMEEIHQRGGFMRLNSRISELRSRGYVIECDKTGGQYVYRLVAVPDEVAKGLTASVPPAASSGTAAAAEPCEATEHVPAFQLAAFSPLPLKEEGCEVRGVLDAG